MDSILELPAPLQITLLALVVISVTLLVVALVAWFRTPDHQMPAPNRWVWLAALLIQFIGPIAFLIARNAARHTTAPTPTHAPVPPTRPGGAQSTHTEHLLDSLYGSRDD